MTLVVHCQVPEHLTSETHVSRSRYLQGKSIHSWPIIACNILSVSTKRLGFVRHLKSSDSVASLFPLVQIELAHKCATALLHQQVTSFWGRISIHAGSRPSSAGLQSNFSIPDCGLNVSLLGTLLELQKSKFPTCPSSLRRAAPIE